MACATLGGIEIRKSARQKESEERNIDAGIFIRHD
jgi:hypothetical protein